jgi:hypothetical protein
MNEHSSRSHAIFIITVECIEVGVDGENHIRVGKLNLVDLAGSERQKKVCGVPLTRHDAVCSALLRGAWPLFSVLCRSSRLRHGARDMRPDRDPRTATHHHVFTAHAARAHTLHAPPPTATATTVHRF